MLSEKDIVHDRLTHWVLKADNQYTVYKTGLTHSESDSSYPLTQDGLSLAIARCNYLAKRMQNEN